MSLLNADLPVGWTWEPVEARFRITKKPRTLNYADVASIPFVPMDGVPAGGGERMKVIRKAPREISSGTYFEKGDILLSKITPSFENGKQGMALDLDAPFGIASTEIIPLQAISNEADHRFLFYYLLHPEVRSLLASKMEGSTGRQRVPDDSVRHLAVAFPPFPEQLLIGSALQLVQMAIRSEAALLSLSHDLKFSAMQQLFSRGLRNETQAETDIGLLPVDWQVASLGSRLTRAQYGLSVKGTPTGTTPILRMNCQERGRVVFRDIQYVNLDAQTLGAFQLDGGDLLFNRTNSFELVGRTSIYHATTTAVFASYLIRLTLDRRDLVSEFVNYYMNLPSTQADLKKLASRGVSQANISASKLKEFPIPVPPTLDEQHEIVEILSTIDRKIDVHERKRATLQDLFNTLLHELMTGRIRVTDLDIDALAGAGPQAVEAS